MSGEELSFQVTIFGESAGSWSVMHQLLSPKVSGLFRGAIGHSGTPMGNLNHRYRTEEEDLAWGSSLTEAVACDQVVTTRKQANVGALFLFFFNRLVSVQEK